MLMTETNIYTTVKRLLSEFTQCTLDDNDDLFFLNIIDSFNVLEIIVLLENEFSIKQFKQEFNHENFSTINKITNFILKEIH